MSDAPPTTPDAPEGAAGDDSGDFDPKIAQERIEKANREAKSLRQRLRELEPLAAKAKEQEDAAKTAEERAAERITAAERRAIQAETKALRLEVAAEAGLTPGQAKRLVGETREELEADAADLIASFPAPPAQEATPQSGRPKERMRPGAVPATESLNGDPLLASLKNKLGIA